MGGSGSSLGRHRMQLARIADRRFPMLISNEEARTEMALSLLEEAASERCRATVELVGMARDRRTLNQVQEVLQAENCKTLM